MWTKTSIAISAAIDTRIFWSTLSLWSLLQPKESRRENVEPGCNRSQKKKAVSSISHNWNSISASLQGVWLNQVLGKGFHNRWDVVNVHNRPNIADAPCFVLNIRMSKTRRVLQSQLLLTDVGSNWKQFPRLATIPQMPWVVQKTERLLGRSEGELKIQGWTSTTTKKAGAWFEPAPSSFQIGGLTHRL